MTTYFIAGLIMSVLRKPDAMRIIFSEDIERILEELSVGELTGIGRRTARNLAENGILTCGELARFPLRILIKRFGVVVEYLRNMPLV